MNEKEVPIVDEEDFIADGFQRIDQRYVSAKPPKIRWGVRYEAMPDAEKVKYLEKLASSMNHAAALVQSERDYFGELCEKQEKQIESLKTAIDQNNGMIQQQITEMNAERQQFQRAIADLKAKVRQLEGGSNN